MVLGWQWCSLHSSAEGLFIFKSPGGKQEGCWEELGEVVVEIGAGAGMCRRRRWGQCSNGPGENSKEKGREGVSRENQRGFHRDYSSWAQAQLCFKGMHIESREQDRTRGLAGPLVPSCSPQSVCLRVQTVLGTEDLEPDRDPGWQRQDQVCPSQPRGQKRRPNYCCCFELMQNRWARAPLVSQCPPNSIALTQMLLPRLG